MKVEIQEGFSDLVGPNIIYLVILGVLVGEHITTRILLKVLRRQFPSFFEKKAFWRRGLAGQF